MTRLRWIRVVPSVLTAVTLLASTLAGAAAGEDVLAIKDVRVFDGARVIPIANVVIRGETIASVAADGKIPDGARVIDGRGKTLFPGLIDAHTHTFAPEHLRAAVVFGVTTELDMFTNISFAAGQRAEQAAGKAAGRADLFSAGMLATAPRGHGTEYGIPVPTITAADQASEWVRARIAEGSDYIKIVYDDGSEIGLPWKSIDESTLAALIRAAKARKKLAVVHVLAREFARRAVAAGADGLVHLFIDKPVDDEFVRLVVEHKAFIIPTLTVLESSNRNNKGNAAVADDPALKPYLTPDDVGALRSSFPGPTAGAELLKIPGATVKALKAAGVRILAGTDCSNPGTAHGASMHRELALLVAAGLTPAEALRAATTETAAAFGLVDRGRIATGLRADFVLVDGDPTVDITVTRRIAGVWKQGRAIDRDAYRGLVRERASALAKLKSAPAPAGSEGGLISDFEGANATTRTSFGAGWAISTDALFGGKSTAATAVVDGGAHDSAHSLKITGTISAGSGQHWAGVLFSPGERSMSPANLSGRAGISFWVKGDGKPAHVMAFNERRGYIPVTKTFVTSRDWKEFRFTWQELDGLDGSGTLGIFWGGGTRPGPFELQLDEIRLLPGNGK
jgi:imidazolonepropionase-like amidohydrolase